MANTYNTGNPLGSNAVKDLSDNASNLDEAVNGESPSWVDRFGKRRETFAGMEAAFEDSQTAQAAAAAAALQASGLAFIGDYDANGPLTITLPNQVFSKNGEYWRSGPNLALPYTTVNNWTTDQPKFVCAGQAVIRSDLNSALPNLGATLVNGVIRHVDTQAQLRALPGQVVPKVYLGGVGPFYADTSDTTSADNGGTILVATDGTRWVLQDANFTSDAFGAIADNSTDATAALQAQVNARKLTGGVVDIDSGLFVVSGGSGLLGAIDINMSSITAEPVTDTHRVSVRGRGRSHTVLMNATNSGYALSVRGAAGVASHYHSRVEGLGFGGGANKAGLYLYDLAFAEVKDLGFWGLNTCMRLDSVLSSDFENVIMSDSAVGLVAGRAAGFSGINAVAMRKFVFRALSTLGGNFTGPFSNLNMDGGSVEGCGTMGLAGSGGIAHSFDGSEGGVGVIYNNYYFENNAGDFDVSLFNSGTNIVTHVFTACNFNRISSTRYTTNNIKIGGGPQRVILIGCTFNGYNDYAEVAGRLYVSYGAGIEVICIGCVFGSPTAQGTLRNIDKSTTFNGQISATGGANSLPNGWTAAKVATGTYTITHNMGVSGGLQSLACSAISASAVQFQRWVITSVNAFSVVMATPAGVLTDCNFSFQFGIG